MRRLLAVACLVLGLGCGGGDEPADALQGTWGLDVNASCALASTFKGNVVEIDFVCLLTDGSIGLEARVGTFTASDTTITTAITQATCPPAEVLRSETFSYALDGSELTVVGTDGALVFQRVSDTGGGSGIVAFGCYDADLNFFPMPIRPLP